MSAASLNTITLIGRIGRAPEEVHAGQTRFARLSVATDDGYRDQNGQKVERTTWHSVTCGGKTADFVLKYLHKGSQILVQGRYLRDAVSWYVQAQRVQSLDGSERGAQNRNCHDHQQGGYDDDWRN